jgi:hypothetical protein
MKAVCQRSGLGWMGLLAALVMGGTVFAQTAAISPEVSGSSVTLATVLQERMALVQERQALIAQGATQQQLRAWREQNASQFEALLQMAEELGVASALQPRPIVQSVNIPPNVSGTLRGFLIARASLANARAQIYNQLLQSLPANASQDQINAMRAQVSQTFQQQHAADLQLQTQRAQALAAASAAQPHPIPGPPAIPANATPQLQAFLTARNALAQARAQVWNEYLSADPATRQAAMQQWRQQNAGSIQQLLDLSQAVSSSTSIQEGQSQ